MISFAYSLMELVISKLKFPYIYLIVDNKSINLSVFMGNLLTLNQQKLRLGDINKPYTTPCWPGYIVTYGSI